MMRFDPKWNTLFRWEIVSPTTLLPRALLGRTIQDLRWVPIYTRHDGLAKRIAHHTEIGWPLYWLMTYGAGILVIDCGVTNLGLIGELPFMRLHARLNLDSALLQEMFEARVIRGAQPYSLRDRPDITEPWLLDLFDQTISEISILKVKATSARHIMSDRYCAIEFKFASGSGFIFGESVTTPPAPCSDYGFVQLSQLDESKIEERHPVLSG